MSTRLYIEDDGDEVVTFRINERPIGFVDHGTHGWTGMKSVILLVEIIAESFNIPVINSQDIV